MSVSKWQILIQPLVAKSTCDCMILKVAQTLKPKFQLFKITELKIKRALTMKCTCNQTTNLHYWGRFSSLRDTVVHPKRKFLLFSQPYVISTCNDLLSIRYFEQVFLCPHNGSQWSPKLPTFSKVSSFVFCSRKKFTQVWSDTRVSKWW